MSTEDLHNTITNAHDDDRHTPSSELSELQAQSKEVIQSQTNQLVRVENPLVRVENGSFVVYNQIKDPTPPTTVNTVYTMSNEEIHDQERKLIQFLDGWRRPKFRPELPSLHYITEMETYNSLVPQNINFQLGPGTTTHRLRNPADPTLTATIVVSEKSRTKSELIKMILATEDFVSLTRMKTLLVRNFQFKRSPTFLEPGSSITDLMKDLPKDCKICVQTTLPEHTDRWMRVYMPTSRLTENIHQSRVTERRANPYTDYFEDFPATCQNCRSET